MGRLETFTEVIRAPHDSKVLSLDLNSGDEVEAGQTLLELDSSSLDQEIEKAAGKSSSTRVGTPTNRGQSQRRTELEMERDRRRYLRQQTQVGPTCSKKSIWPISAMSPGRNFSIINLRFKQRQPEGSSHSFTTSQTPDETRIRAMLQQEAAQ